MPVEPTRVLGVDPGERHLGLAISDEGGLLARPLATLNHISRAEDAARIVALAEQHGAGSIVLGCALDSDGRAGPQARHAEKLAQALRQRTLLPVVLHDESFSSLEAADALRAAGKTRRALREQIHAVAAATLLQSYLESHTK